MTFWVTANGATAAISIRHLSIGSKTRTAGRISMLFTAPARSAIWGFLLFCGSLTPREVHRPHSQGCVRAIPPATMNKCFVGRIADIGYSEIGNTHSPE